MPLLHAASCRFAYLGYWQVGATPANCLRVAHMEIDCSAATDDSCCCLCAAQYYLYNVLFARWCKHITKVVGHFGSAPVKTFLDQAIQ